MITAVKIITCDQQDEVRESSESRNELAPLVSFSWLAVQLELQAKVGPDVSEHVCTGGTEVSENLEHPRHDPFLGFSRLQRQAANVRGVWSVMVVSPSAPTSPLSLPSCVLLVAPPRLAISG
eukprot:766406-Hanusia_phi.AAC.2